MSNLLENHEYRKLSYFKDRTIPDPDKLNKLRRTHLTYSFITFSFILIGIQPESIYIGVVAGKTERPEYILVILSFIFFYYFHLYDTELKNAYFKFIFQRGISNYTASLILYIFEKVTADISAISDFKIGHNRLAFKKHDSKKDMEYRVNINFKGIIRDDIINTVSERLNKEHNIEVSHDKVHKEMLNIKYVLTDKDVSFYEKYKDYAKNLNKREQFEYNAPKAFGVLILIFIIIKNYYFISHQLS